MEFNNYTPFVSLAWENVDHNEQWYITSLLRVKYKIVKTNNDTYELVYDKEQGELFDSDEYYEKVGNSSVRYESDIIPFKKYTDIIINAKAVSPKEDGELSWSTNVKIYDDTNSLLKEYPLAIKAEKIYHKAGIIWTPTISKKQKSVDIRYEKAYGGTIFIIDEKTQEEQHIYCNQFNPIGCGVKKIKDPKPYINSEQILHIDGKKRDIPAGYGFIDKSWKTRLPYAGTFDEQWLENKHPILPDDYDIYYNQAANTNLIMDTYIKHNYKIQLINLKNNHLNISFTIPKLNTLIRIKNELTTSIHKMNIDTIIVDLDDENDDENFVYISYRAYTKKTFDTNSVDIMINNEKGDNNG